MSKSALAIATEPGSFRFLSYGVRFFVLPAQALAPIMLMLLHIRAWTFWLALVSCLFFAILNRFGYTPRYAWWAVRSAICGPLLKRVRMLGWRRLGRI